MRWMKCSISRAIGVIPASRSEAKCAIRPIAYKLIFLRSLLVEIVGRNASRNQISWKIADQSQDWAEISKWESISRSFLRERFLSFSLFSHPLISRWNGIENGNKRKRNTLSPRNFHTVLIGVDSFRVWIQRQFLSSKRKDSTYTIISGADDDSLGRAFHCVRWEESDILGLIWIFTGAFRRSRLRFWLSCERWVIDLEMRYSDSLAAADALTFSPEAEIIRRSAGIRSPPFTSTMSPTTRSSVRTLCFSPLRITNASCKIGNRWLFYWECCFCIHELRCKEFKCSMFWECRNWWYHSRLLWYQHRDITYLPILVSAPDPPQTFDNFPVPVPNL